MDILFEKQHGKYLESCCDNFYEKLVTNEGVLPNFLRWSKM